MASLPFGGVIEDFNVVIVDVLAGFAVAEPQSDVVAKRAWLKEIIGGRKGTGEHWMLCGHSSESKQF